MATAEQFGFACTPGSKRRPSSSEGYPAMRWLFRFIWFVSRSLVALLVWMVVNTLRFLLPILLALLRFLMSQVATSLSALVYGPRRYVKGLSSKWTVQLLDRGVSREYLDQVNGLCIFLATSKILIGLLIAGVFLVAVLRVVYGIWI